MNSQRLFVDPVPKVGGLFLCITFSPKHLGENHLWQAKSRFKGGETLKTQINRNFHMPEVNQIDPREITGINRYFILEITTDGGTK
jgi:hypothetical protein